MSEPEASTFTATDGYPLHVVTWPTAAPRASVVVLHGVQSHAGWYEHLGKSLADAGLEAHFPDRRGSGRNQRDRGHTPSRGRLFRDVSEYLERVRTRRPGVPVVLGGISWGGKLAVVTAARRGELLDGLALFCPGLEPRVGVSRAEATRIALAYFLHRRKHFPIPLADPSLFTGNRERQAFIADDPLSLRTATAGLLAASNLIDRAVKRSPGKVRVPTLLMLAGRDRIVDNERTRCYFERIASPSKTIVEYPEAHHTLEFEPEPARYAADLIAWIDSAVLATPAATRP